jgi:hypothetical protein
VRALVVVIAGLISLPLAAESTQPTCAGDQSAWSACRGSITYANGDQYVGEFENGEPSGRGTYRWSDGRKYVGEFRFGKRTGKGRMIYPPSNLPLLPVFPPNPTR